MNQKQIEELLDLIDRYAAMQGVEAYDDQVDVRDQIEAKLRESAGWQPIETAPKDQWVLVAYPDREVSKAIFNVGVWMDWDGDLYGTPTHWQPLLEAPQ